MSQLKIDEFLNVLRRSSLLPADLLAKVSRRANESKTPVDPRSVAKWLVEKQYISLWQARQLLAGRDRFYLGRYRLIDRIGKGGMGVVFKAQHDVMARTVALKVMARHLLKKPRAVERFNREVKTAAALHHPNIITAFDADRVGNTHFLVMEYVEGSDLNAWLRARGPLPIAAACECAMQAAEGLSHAYAQKMVHRDIKPVNMLVTWNSEKSRPVVKLLDMGLARFVSETQEEGALTRVGQTIGTPDYIAPEAAENFKHADIRADIFSLGCALFRLLTGKLPFPGENTMEKLLARATRDAPVASSLRPEISPELDQVIARMLARDPTARYQTPDEVVQALSPFAASRVGNQGALEFFRTPITATERVSASDLEPDADTSLQEFFRDFSRSPVREESPAPDDAPPAELELQPEPDAAAELELAPLEEVPHTVAPKPASSEKKKPASKSPPPSTGKSAAVTPDKLATADEELAPIGDELELISDEGALTAVVIDDADPFVKKERPTSRARTAKLKPGKSGWDSNLMMVGGGVLLALFIALGVLVWSIFRETGDQALELAENEYRSGAYTQAVHRYDLYLANYPSHTGVGLARVHRGLAQLRQATSGGGDWSKALDTAKQVLSEISREQEFGEASGDLASLLPAIAEGLAQQAREKQDPARVEQSREALALVARWVPKAMQSEQQLTNIDQLLALTTREIDREAALNKAVAEMNDAVGAGETRRAYDVRKQLLKIYPDLQSNAALVEAVTKIVEAEQAAVAYTAAEQPAETAPVESPIVASVSLARTTGAAAPGVEGQVVSALVDGAAYGLDATNGTLLWRQFVGFETRYVPTPLNADAGSDLLLVDGARRELCRVESHTGKPRWRHPLGEPLVADPVLLRDRVLVSTKSGKLIGIQLDTGSAAGSTQIPDELAVAPGIDARQRYAYLPGEHSTLYVISLADGTCAGATYVGHEPGTIRVAPVLASRYVLLVDNHRLNSSVLRVFVGNEHGLELKPVQEVPLEGHVDVAPLVRERWLSVITDRGAIYTFEIGTPDQPTPLTNVATTPPQEGEPLTRYFLAAGNQLFVADDRFTKYDVQAANARLSPRWVNDQHDKFLQPLRAAGNVLFHVRRKEGWPGALVSAVSSSDGKRIWETALAAPLAGGPQVDTAAASVGGMTTTGSIYSLPSARLAGNLVASQPNQHLDLSMPIPDASRLVALANDWTAVGAADEQRVIVFQGGGGDRRPRFVSLPDTLACQPGGIAGGLLAPGKGGQVSFVPAEPGAVAIEPFQPALAAGATIGWLRPTALSETEALLADGSTRLYRLTVESQPAAHLAAAATVEFETPLVTPAAVAGSFAYAVDAKGRLLAFKLPDLAPGEPWNLGGRVAWGPYGAGDHVVLVTEDAQMHCFDSSGQNAWKAPLPHGSLTGEPAAVGDSIVLATVSGVVYRVAADTGESTGRVELGCPLASGPLSVGTNLVVAGHDGTLYVVPQP
ncbi:MAG: protein kinase [Pirellulales bacterium]|nr:protein kinase [Pirellulales bacterium]